jgi:predicted AAA+ superfamily ATPase
MTDPLIRIAEALERLAPAPMPAPDFTAAEAFAWHTAPDRLEPVAQVSRVDIGLLVGINRSRDTLLENTRHFAAGLPANNALLWGARGMGKSSLVKAIHAKVVTEGLPLKIGASWSICAWHHSASSSFVMICRSAMMTSITNR